MSTDPPQSGAAGATPTPKAPLFQFKGSPPHPRDYQNRGALPPNNINNNNGTADPIKERSASTSVSTPTTPLSSPPLPPSQTQLPRRIAMPKSRKLSGAGGDMLGGSRLPLPPDLREGEKKKSGDVLGRDPLLASRYGSNYTVTPGLERYLQRTQGLSVLVDLPPPPDFLAPRTTQAQAGAQAQASVFRAPQDGRVFQYPKRLAAPRLPDPGELKTTLPPLPLSPSMAKSTTTASQVGLQSPKLKPILKPLTNNYVPQQQKPLGSQTSKVDTSSLGPKQPQGPAKAVQREAAPTQPVPRPTAAIPVPPPQKLASSNQPPKPQIPAAPVKPAQKTSTTTQAQEQRKQQQKQQKSVPQPQPLTQNPAKPKQKPTQTPLRPPQFTPLLPLPALTVCNPFTAAKAAAAEDKNQPPYMDEGYIPPPPFIFPYRIRTRVRAPRTHPSNASNRRNSRVNQNSLLLQDVEPQNQQNQQPQREEYHSVDMYPAVTSEKNMNIALGQYRSAVRARMEERMRKEGKMGAGTVVVPDADAVYRFVVSSVGDSFRKGSAPLEGMLEMEQKVGLVWRFHGRGISEGVRNLALARCRN
ncbi:hypothetical protein DFH27DRAFT_526159 [Peziza echinospora]|nr:hypothetical protein DFH27DRAFT_526159 [Peziza echinospora]